MSAVWEISLADSEKLVLLALADWSNDAGECWPSMAQLVRKTSKSDRTIQQTIKRLAVDGHLTRVEVPGRGCRYVIHPNDGLTPEVTSPPKRLRPETASPPKGATQTPEAASDNTSRTTISSPEASPPPKTRPKAADPFPKPEWANEQHWLDFLANRKRKRLPNTATAYTRMLTDIDRLADAEWPPGRILQAAAERGWAGIYDPRERNERNGTGNWNGGAGRGPKVDGFRAALRSARRR